jgi:hypothetical protein
MPKRQLRQRVEAAAAGVHEALREALIAAGCKNVKIEGPTDYVATFDLPPAGARGAAMRKEIAEEVAERLGTTATPLNRRDTSLFTIKVPAQPGVKAHTYHIDYDDADYADEGLAVVSVE